MVAEVGFEPTAFGLWAQRAATAPLRDDFGAEDRNRTGTVSPPQDFKSCASASSATTAYKWLQGRDSNPQPIG